MAEKLNLAKKSAKKDSYYSKGKSSTKQENGPSAKVLTSDKSWELNNSEFTGSGKGLVLSLCFIESIKGRELNALTLIVAGPSLLLLLVGAETVV